MWGTRPWDMFLQQLNFKITYIQEVLGVLVSVFHVTGSSGPWSLDLLALTQQQQAVGIPEQLHLKPGVTQERGAYREGGL